MKSFHDLDKLSAGLRRDYSFGTLTDQEGKRNPYALFVKWFEAARKMKVLSLNAVMFATCGHSRRPSARIVLVKGFDAKGFIFYTHYQSKKARDIQENPQAEMVFYWPEMERQVRVSGVLAKISALKSDAYFRCRPRSAQIGAWASHQSAAILNRRELEMRYQGFEKKFEGKSVPRPESWGGYCLAPRAYEFWQGRASRLNDRLLYKKAGSSWKRQRLQP